MGYLSPPEVKYLACKFGVFRTPATWVSLEHAVCYAPSCKDAKGIGISQLDDRKYRDCSGPVKVSLTINGQESGGEKLAKYRLAGASS